MIPTMYMLSWDAEISFSTQRNNKEELIKNLPFLILQPDLKNLTLTYFFFLCARGYSHSYSSKIPKF